MSEIALTKQHSENSTEAANHERAIVKPRFQIVQNDNTYELLVSLPGVAKENVTLSFSNTSLTIEAKKTPIGGKGWEARFAEIPEVDYRLHLDLNVQVNADGVSARSENGLLIVTLPLADTARKREISVA